MAPTKYTAVSFPKDLLAAIDKIVEEVGYWPSTTAFVREACIEKLNAVLSDEEFTVRLAVKAASYQAWESSIHRQKP